MPYTSSLIILSYSCFPVPMCFFRQQISYVFLFPCAFSDSRFQVFLFPCASSDSRFQVFLFPCASSDSRVPTCASSGSRVPMCFFRLQISHMFLFPCASSGSRFPTCSCSHVLLQAADFLCVLVPMCFGSVFRFPA